VSWLPGPEERQVLLFTLQTSALGVALTLPLGVLLGWLLARRSFPGKALVETLKLVGRRGALGALLHELGADVAFTWRAVVLATSVMAFPLLVRGVRLGFSGVSPRLEQIARTLGAGERRVFLTVSLPLALPGIVGGAVLAYARARGEFGATMMVFHAVQLGEDAAALRLMGYSVALAFLAVAIGERLLARREGRL
jgi:molybdate transport system permease protein